MTMAEATALLADVPGWELLDFGRKLRRTFTFHNFMLAQSFAVETGNLCESENHHPDISYGWGYCTVVFYTHKIGGLHRNDFVMAARVNALRMP
ncbi:4a-hydroxytetrahydrobiopterin dehydratase [Mariprofundus erugo]|uniref:4a-hydroxytetrahydrobiopterin dehydratase n=2 Tax=Mariprofundus erugo TaxID=2528639 RepID=A0A5R9GQ28_9PROT|nr:4a-hydroxytetrahydrobiopterin dehydratase [Mariprofundus erugo]TLS73679.1 4a-hydroxytetrahydrobiopterin dehydratase [Mariprofundus erugo]